MVMATDAAAQANHKNDTRNYSDTYVKRLIIASILFELLPLLGRIATSTEHSPTNFNDEVGIKNHLKIRINE